MRDAKQKHELRSHALREIGDFFVWREIKQREISPFQVIPPFWKEASRKADDLRHGHVGIQILFFRHEAHSTADLEPSREVPNRLPEDARVAAIEFQKAHQELDRCCLSRTIAAEEAVDAPGRHL